MRTVEDARARTEADLFDVFPDLQSRLVYLGHFTSRKTKYDLVTDDRSLRWGQQGRYMSFSGGKITGMFEMERILQQTLGLSPV